MSTVESAPSLTASRSPEDFAEAPHGVSTAVQSHGRQLVGRIGPWQLVRLLHEGELARVYTARPVESADDAPAAYVVKVLRKEWWRDPHAIEMQRRAAWVGRQVSHSHLLPVLSAGVEQPPFYLVSPRLDGRSLSEILERERRLPLANALWIARQTAEALDALHVTARMIHSDVKPANIIVDPDGHATLIDLGFVHAPQDGRHWSARPVFGTLNYLAPECLASSIGSSPQSDVYSLGVMVYEMIAGSVPFVGHDAEQLIRCHRQSQPAPLATRRQDIPSAVSSLVHRMLAKDPLRRPADAAAVVDELVRLEVECFALR